jgi:recombination protein RecT
MSDPKTPQAPVKVATQTAAVAQQSPEIRQIVDDVSSRIVAMQETKQLDFPKDYSVQNALRAAGLVLQDAKNAAGTPLLEACTKSSIANSLMKMAVLGLNPLKKQGSFIAYGDRLEFQEEIGGRIALAKRFGKLKHITANVIYEGDKPAFAIDTETGFMKLVSHEIDINNIDINKINGAYAIAVLEDGSSQCTVMSMTQIRQAWAQAVKGETPAHKKFPDEMAKKTVMGRALKHLIRSSDDSAIMIGDEDEPTPAPDKPEAPKASQAVREIVIKPNEAVNVVDVAAATAPQAEKPPFG